MRKSKEKSALEKQKKMAELLLVVAILFALAFDKTGFLEQGLIESVFTINANALPGDLGEPFSSFQKGTAKSLEGRTVIISYFVNTPSSSWTAKKIKKELPVMDTAFQYIIRQAKNYDVECEFIYDWEEADNRDLIHRRTIMKDPEETKDFEYYLDDMLAIWKDGAFSYDDYLKKYDADNVFMMVFFDGDGRDYAISYDGEDSPQESMISYSTSGASVMAHEVLHLFGAHDFYEGAEYKEETTSYLENEYKNDIMLKVNPPGKITKTIGAVTAYHLGWTDDCPDLKDHPELKRQ